MQQTAETLNGRGQGDPEFKRAVRDYVRAYEWRHGRRKTAEDLGVSRHTLWRFLERGNMGRAVPSSVLSSVGGSVRAIERARQLLLIDLMGLRLDPAMRPLREGLEEELLLLCAAPLTTVDELSRLGRVPASTLRERLDKLAKRELADSVPHHLSVLGARSQRRYFPTEKGVLAGGAATQGRAHMLQAYPVSKQWFRLLAERLDAVVVAQAFLWSSYISYETTDMDGRWSLPEERERVLDPNQEGVVRTIEVAEENLVTFVCEGVRKGELPPEVQSMSQEDQAQVIEICEDEAENERLFRELSRRSFILPDSLVRSLGFAHTIGAMLVLIMASLAIGVEYGWGTLREVLTKGIRRWQFLGAKALLLVLMVAAGLLILSLTVVVSSLLAALLTLHEGGGLADSGEWRTAAVMFGKMVYALTPYVILALFLSVLTASSSIGIALSLAYHLAEIFLMNTLLESFGSVSGFLLGPSVIAWMVETGARIWAVDNIPVPVSDLPSNLHAFLVLLAYIVVLGSVAFWRFQRNDIAGARGE